jgi:hypothetical protein
MKTKFSSKIEQETSTESKKYFSTPNTAIEKQRNISRYDNFDDYSKAYQRSVTKTTIEKYVISRKN